MSIFDKALGPNLWSRVRVPASMLLLPGVVLVAGWVFSGWLYHVQDQAVKREDQEHFQNLVDDAQNELSKRMASLEDALRGGAGFFMASTEVVEIEWKTYTESLRLRERYPGMSGFGLVLPVPEAGLDEFVARAKADNAPDFAIWGIQGTARPPDGPQGRMHYIVRHIEMLDGSKRASGLDLASEANRRTAAEVARDTGLPALTKRIIRATDQKQRPGFLLFVPMYRGGKMPAAPAERQAAFLGWAFAPFVTDNFLDGALGGTGRELDLHFFEGRSTAPADLLYHSDHANKVTRVLERTTELVLAGQTFTLGWSRKPGFVSRDASTPLWIVSGLTTVTLLLSGLILSLETLGWRANQLAEKRTRELGESETRFRILTQNAPVGILQTDAKGDYLYVNERWSELAGLTLGEAKGEGWSSALHPDDRIRVLEAWAAFARGEREFTLEYRFVHKNGTLAWVAGRAVALRDSAGQQDGYLGTVADISERKELEAQLTVARDQALEASRLKSEFLANMSHEIRTPMNGVLGMADLLMDTSLNEEQKQMGQVIRGSAENLLTIIDDILDFSKIEAGKLRIESADFNLRAQIEQVLALLAPRAMAQGLTLASDLPPHLPPGLSGDAGRIQQVLVNLMGNAVKFTEKGGVTLAVRPLRSARPDYYAFRIEVRDTGIGITAEQKARLFQPFSQADGSTTRRYGGTGLGLAIAQQLLQLMDGRIGLESAAGQGSVFWFELELPLVKESAPRLEAGGIKPALAVHAGARILVTEDNTANQLLIRLQLNRLGLSHEIVSDGRAAIERLASGDYAAVLMDCQMPLLDGYETTQQIRAGAAGVRQPKIPIIALTAHAMASDREKCLASGMDKYLSKPIRLEELQQVLQSLGVVSLPSETPEKPAKPPVSAVLEPAQLAQLSALPGRQGSALLDDLVAMALKELPVDIVRLHALVEQRTGAELVQLAHRLAGSAASLGAVSLRVTLQAMEQAGRKGDWSDAESLRPGLDHQWHLVRDALQKLSHPPRT